MNLQVNKFIKHVNEQHLATDGVKFCEHVAVGTTAYIHQLDGSTVLFCEDCHEHQLELDASGQCYCADCGKVILLVGSHQWTWFDYDVSKGHKPVTLCYQCTKEPKHLERVKFDKLLEEKASSIYQSVENTTATSTAFSCKSATLELDYLVQHALHWVPDSSHPEQQRQNSSLELVLELVEDYVSQQLIWVDPKALQLAKSVTTHPRFSALFEKTYGCTTQSLSDEASIILSNICDKVHRTIYNIIQGPTWNVWHVTKNGTTVILEKSADWRVIQWYKEQDLVYGASPKDLY